MSPYNSRLISLCIHSSLLPWLLVVYDTCSMSSFTTYVPTRSIKFCIAIYGIYPIFISDPSPSPHPINIFTSLTDDHHKFVRFHLFSFSSFLVFRFSFFVSRFSFLVFRFSFFVSRFYFKKEAILVSPRFPCWSS